ncbi:hypothetical protein DFJ73DRAFT_668574 [Zopfochytrium polystomum]|nr:hypothetical protein DFJ73DRAFT_668574 [Zopfochytrium polystomum]
MYEHFLLKPVPFTASHARMARQVLLKSVVYTYPGRNPSLKPILLCAHFDTVPVDANAMQRWRFPPFSGKIYNNMIWGRGTADTKGTLIAIFEALETLIATGFEPSRTIVLAFGHDEETASSGAGAIAEFLDSTYGPNGIELIVDEGSTVTTMFGSEYAVVSTSEKGYVDLTLNVTTAGGHSSSPPPHTSIGILAHAIYALEKRPFAPKIQNAKDHPLTRHLTCLALDERSTLDRSAAEEKLAEFLAAHPSLMPDSEPVLTTTQAVNIIGGGASPNSLPESAASLVNYRVAMHMTVQDVVDAVAGTLKDVAAAHGILLFAGAASSSSALSFSSTYRSYGGAAVGELALLTNPGVIHPAPVTPSTGPVWDQLAGVVRAVFRGPDGRPPFVVPAVLVGNTDTNNYLSLSRHIFRFSPMRTDGGENLHTVDEHLRVSSFVEAIEFYQLLVLEFDGTSAAAADS